MEGEAWGFNAIGFELNIDDSEDFDLSIAVKTANNLDLPYLRKHRTRLSAIAYLQKHERQHNAPGSQCVSSVV